MKRNRRAILVAVLVVVAIGLATATLANPIESGGGLGGSGGGGGIGEGPDESGQDGEDGGAQPGGGALSVSFGACIPFLTTPTFYALALLALVTVVGIIRWRTNTMVAVAVPVAFAAPFVFLHAFLTKCGTPPEEQPGSFSPMNVSNRTLPVVGGDVGGAADAATSPPTLIVLLVIVLAALFLLFVRGSGDDSPPPDPPDPETDESLGDVAAAAGQAADRIEADADVENVVYRAWRDMTGHLDIDDPRTTTPAEFAAAARDAGMAPGHVDTLTDVFREVRYGGEPVTEERERRALDALRDIEATYGEADDGGADG